MNLNEPINAQRVGQAVGNYRWTICAMLFFATTVNYLDRQVLSLLAPQLSTQFGWSNTDYANIAAVFQFVYAISMLFAGRLVDKIGTKTAYVVAIGIWSTGAIMHAFSVPMGEGIAAVSGAIGLAVIPVSIAGFMLSRAVLAIGEAGNFPIAIKATAEYFPKKERSFATGIFNSGAEHIGDEPVDAKVEPFHGIAQCGGGDRLAHLGVIDNGDVFQSDGVDAFLARFHGGHSKSEQGRCHRRDGTALKGQIQADTK